MSKSNVQRLDPLTSLRFVAAGMIVVGHAAEVFGSIEIVSLFAFAQGVSFFFVLSGFILAWNYPNLISWHERRKFWLARFARAWPLHIVTVCLWLLLVYSFDKGRVFSEVGIAKLIANILLLQTWIPLKYWAMSFNGVSWSISVEMFFYLAFPALIIAMKRNWHLVLLALTAFLSVYFIGINYIPHSESNNAPGLALLGLIYTNPPVRLLEFVIGIALASVVRRLIDANFRLTPAQWSVLELFAVASVVIMLIAAAGGLEGIRKTLGVPVAYYMTTCGFWVVWANLIGVFSLSNGVGAKLLSKKICVFLGEISFSLYLIHALILAALSDYVPIMRNNSSVYYVLYWIACLCLSSLLYLGVEQPFRRLILSKNNDLRFGQRLAQNFSGTAAIAGGSLIVAVLAMFYIRPSTINTLDADQVSMLLGSSAKTVRLSDSSVFDGRYRIEAIQFSDGVDGQTTVKMLINNLVKTHANDALVLHVVNNAGDIIFNSGTIMDFGRFALNKNQYWVESFTVPTATLNSANEIGVAMFQNVTALFPFSGLSSDWDGRRMKLNL